VRSEESFVANEMYGYYSQISQPSFAPFKELVKKADDFLVNPFVREVLLGNIEGLDIKLVDRYYTIINLCRSEEELELGDAADFFGRELMGIIYRSNGKNQAFLKALLTSYSISEQKSEAREYSNLMQEKEEEEKKDKWSFVGGFWKGQKKGAVR
jgi:hypothetical protein